MLLENKNAVIYGGGGAVGGAVARAFAREGATVYLAGRTLAGLDLVAQEICAAGGKAETAEVDAMDEGAVDRHADAVCGKGGRHRHRTQCRWHRSCPGHSVRGAVFRGLRTSDHGLHAHKFPHCEGCCAAHGKTALRRDSSARPRAGRADVGSGVLGKRRLRAAVEAISRILAGELGPSGIRVICLRPHAIPEAVATSHTRQLFNGMAGLSGLTTEAWLSELARTTLLGRLPTLAEVADVPRSWHPIGRAR